MLKFNFMLQLKMAVLSIDTLCTIVGAFPWVSLRIFRAVGQAVREPVTNEVSLHSLVCVFKGVVYLDFINL